MNNEASEALLSLTKNLLLLELLAEQELNAAKEIEQRQHQPLFPEWKTFPTGSGWGYLPDESRKLSEPFNEQDF